MRSSFTAAIAALSLIVAPTAAIAAAPSANASDLSLSQGARSGASLQGANGMSDTGYVLLGVGGLALLILFFVLIDDDDEDLPSSP